MAGLAGTLGTRRGPLHRGCCSRHYGTVLVAAPHERLCRMVSRFVTELGHQAVAATDGGAAIRLGALHAPDLVIMAENMPGMRATDFLDAGLGALLTRRVLLVPRRTAGTPRHLPTLELPIEAARLSRRLRHWLTVSDRH